ncbi:MAG: zinc ribbon domain-containing protein, partial [Promethearchaeota archaeon]
MIICSNCGTTNSSEERICRTCGALLPVSNKSPRIK